MSYLDLNAAFERTKGLLSSETGALDALALIDDTLSEIRAAQFCFRMMRAGALSMLDMNGEARAFIDEMIETYPYAAEPRFQMGCQHFYDGEWLEALERFDQALLKYDPEEDQHFIEELFQKRIACLAKLDGTYTALQFCKVVMRSHPEFKFIKQDLADLEDESYLMPEAIRLRRSGTDPG